MAQDFADGVRLGVMAAGTVVGFCGMLTIGCWIVAVAMAVMDRLTHRK